MGLETKCTGPVSMIPLLMLLALCLMTLLMSAVYVIPRPPKVAANTAGTQTTLSTRITKKTLEKKITPRHQSASWTKPLPKVSNITTPRTGVFILKPQFHGRLGNHMFLYASVYALAVSKNMSLYVEGGNQLKRIFKLDPEIVTNRKCNKWTKVFSPCCDYDPTLEQRIEPDKCQIVGEYLQSWKYFVKYRDVVKRSFSFNSNIQSSARTKISFLIQTYKTKLDNATNVFPDITLVGIHARQGDYLHKMSRKQGRITPPASYYIRAMDYFRKKFPNTVFLAASDSVSWLKTILKRKDVIILGGKNPEEDLCMLSMCNHTIMSVGTFGWWAGFLAGGTTIYYSHELKNTTLMGKKYKKYETDFIYKNWIGMK